MPKNYLYSLINKDFILNSIGKLPSNTGVKKVLNGQNKSYFIFALPKTGREVIGEYTLLGHHVSVYENPLTKFDEKSPYHYTAYFCNAKKEEFRLHIYYNGKNQCISRPILEKIVRDNEFSPMNSEEYDDAFYALAQQHTNALTTFLRHKHETLIAELEAQYALLDQCSIALSAALPEMKEAYVAALNKQIAKLNELLTYSQFSNHAKINGTIAMLKSFISSIGTYQSEKDEKTSKRTVLGDITNTGNASKNTILVGDNAISDTLIIGERTAKKGRDLKLELEKLKEQFAGLKAKKSVTANEVSDLFTALIGIESDIDLGIYSLSLAKRYELKVLRQGMESLIANILEQLLNTEQFQQANELTPFYSLLPEKILYDALAANKWKLIDNLLKNKNFRLNASNFTYQSQQYSSLIDYYFKNTRVLISNGGMNPKISQAMAVSLGILIKNKHSLMDIDSDTGLPFAAVLIKEPKHPLTFALDLNKAATIGNPLFCKQLKQVLHFILLQANCSEANKKIIPQLIKQLDDKIVSLPSASAQATLDQLKLPVRNLKETASGIALYEEIYSDPVVTWMTNKADIRIASFKWDKPLNQQALLFNDATFIIRTFTCGDDSNFELDAVALMKIRNAIIGRKKAIIDFIVLAEELFAVQKLVVTDRKSNKKLKEDEKRLIERFRALETAVVDSNIHLYNVMEKELRTSLQTLHPAPNAMCKSKQQKNPVATSDHTQGLAEDLIGFVINAAKSDSGNKLNGMELVKMKELLTQSFMKKMCESVLVEDPKKEPKNYKSKESTPPLIAKHF